MNAHNPVSTGPAVDLSSKAMLAAVRIKQWSGRKLDRQVTDEVNRQHGAAADAGRYNKALISRDALAEILTIAGRARKEHYARTLPWHDDGNRILSAAGYLDYANVMRGLRGEFEAAVAGFAAGYADFVDEARIRLNGMFRAEDYPAPDDIAARFGFEHVLQPLPAAGDFRVTVSDADAAKIRADIEARTNAAVEAAVRDVFQRIGETVGHMAEKLAEYKPAEDGNRATGIFRDSLVENVRDLAELLPSLNVTESPELARIAERMKAELCGHDAAELRDNESARQDVAAKAAAIAEHVSTFMA